MTTAQKFRRVRAWAVRYRPTGECIGLFLGFYAATDKAAREIAGGNPCAVVPGHFIPLRPKKRKAKR